MNALAIQNTGNEQQSLVHGLVATSFILHSIIWLLKSKIKVISTSRNFLQLKIEQNTVQFLT